MNLDQYTPRHKDESVSALEAFRRERSVRKMKKFVVSQMSKGKEIVPANTSRFSGALESTMNPNSDRNAYIVSKVQYELSRQGVEVETIDHIMDADSADAYLYGFKRVDLPGEAREAS